MNCVHIQSVAETQSQLQVYPNPNSGSFTIITEDKASYQLFNKIGQAVLSGVCEGETQIDTNLPKGIYFLRIDGAAGSRVEKLVIE